MQLVGPAPKMLEIGNGLDLGFVRGFFAAEDDFRWSSALSEVTLSAPQANTLIIELAAPRPAGLPSPHIAVFVDGHQIGQLQADATWQTYQIPAQLQPGRMIVTIRSDVFRPRDHDRASPDNRTLGVMIKRIEVR